MLLSALTPPPTLGSRWLHLTKRAPALLPALLAIDTSMCSPVSRRTPGAPLNVSMLAILWSIWWNSRSLSGQWWSYLTQIWAPLSGSARCYSAPMSSSYSVVTKPRLICLTLQTLLRRSNKPNPPLLLSLIRRRWRPTRATIYALLLFSAMSQIMLRDSSATTCTRLTATLRTCTSSRWRTRSGTSRPWRS